MKILNMQSFKDGTILSTAKHFVWYKPMTWLPAIIRTITGGFVSHSAIVINIDGICMVAESKVPKVQLQTFASWLTPHMDVYITIPEKVPEDFRNRVLSKLGNSKYDYRSLFFTQPFQILTGIWIPTGQGERGEPFTCSEFVSYTLGLQDPWKNKPADLVKDNYELIIN
jgi:hypothetical protein